MNDTSESKHLGGRCRPDDPETSAAAGNSVDATYMEGVVLRALAKFPDGATSVELAAVLQLTPWSVSPRMKPLESKGHVLRDGTRFGSSGRRQIVWKRKSTATANFKN